ncbi:MAG: hypothetical protein JJT76_00075 [Clostridiaceae bacterium]|nr:hypothetical protein [Clostridiaceae bacterium]
MISIKNKTTILAISLVINLILVVFLAGYNVEVADHNNRESIRTLKSMSAFSQKMQVYLEADSPTDRKEIAEDLHQEYGRILYGRSGIININVPFAGGDKAFYNTVQELSSYIFGKLYFSYIDAPNRRETGEEFSEEEKQFVCEVLNKFEEFHEPLEYTIIADGEARNTIVRRGTELISFTRELEEKYLQ